jgi:hypothetical protein
MKNLYFGTINWAGETHNFYSHSTKEHSAKINMCFQLARKLKVHPQTITVKVLITEPNRITIKQIEKE